MLPKKDLIHNLRILLDSQLLLYQQIEAVNRRVIAQLWLMYQLCVFLKQEALTIVIHFLTTFQPDYLSLHRSLLKSS